MAEYKIEKLTGTQVTHMKFGTGTVTDAKGTAIEVAFSGVGKKRFQYPDAFERFLAIEDEAWKMQIATDLETRHLEDDYIQNRKTMEMYANTRAFDKKKAEEHERRAQMQMEKQRQSQLRGQRMMFGRRNQEVKPPENPEK